jgi:hypothetical protein
MKLAASRSVTNLHPTGNVIGSSNSRLQPDLRSGIFLAPEHPSGREEEARGSERDLMDRRLLEVVWRSLWGSRLRTQRWVGVARRQIAPPAPAAGSLNTIGMETHPMLEMTLIMAALGLVTIGLIVAVSEWDAARRRRRF